MACILRLPSNESVGVLSITTQLIGEKPLKPSEEEKTLRLKLAKLGVVDIDESLNSAQMRKMAFGLFLEQHSLLISSEMQKSNNFKSQEISLVSQIKSRTNPNVQIVLLDTPMKNNTHENLLANFQVATIGTELHFV